MSTAPRIPSPTPLGAADTRMARLVGVAHQLGEAASRQQVLEVLRGAGAGALGAVEAVLWPSQPHPAGDGTGELADEEADGRAGVPPGADLLPALADLPEDVARRVVAAARTGASWFADDHGHGAARTPSRGDDGRAGAHRTEPFTTERFTTGGCAAVPLQVRGEVVGALAVAFDGPHRWATAERELLRALAAMSAQALDRITAQRAAAAAADRTERVLGALRRSLRPVLPVSPGAAVAVRYRPVDDLELGGDWYDVLPTPGGGLLVAVGDVVGHDGVVAASAVQARSLLRGAAAVRPAPPSASVRVLDAALAGPDVDVVASLVLCRLSTAGAGWRVEWCNAGHPPPLLVLPRGPASLLGSEEEPLLGVLPAVTRSDHEVEAPAGSTLLLYSDGLVERRGTDVDDRLHQLRDLASDGSWRGPEELCDHLLVSLDGSGGDDDVTLVAVSLTGSRGATASAAGARRGASATKSASTPAPAG